MTEDCGPWCLPSLLDLSEWEIKLEICASHLLSPDLHFFQMLSPVHIFDTLIYLLIYFLIFTTQGLNWIAGPGYSFRVFSTSRFVPPALSSVDDTVSCQKVLQTYCKDVITRLFLRQFEKVLIFRHTFFSFTVGPNWPSRHSLRKCSFFVTNWGSRILANLRTFWCTFSGLNSLVVCQNWQISGMLGCFEKIKYFIFRK